MAGPQLYYTYRGERILEESLTHIYRGSFF